jgi:hypothetical protein
MELIPGRIKVLEACQKLDCGRRTIERYCHKFLQEGPGGLVDRKHSNYHWLSNELRHNIHVFIDIFNISIFIDMHHAEEVIPSSGIADANESAKER